MDKQCVLQSGVPDKLGPISTFLNVLWVHVRALVLCGFPVRIWPRGFSFVRTNCINPHAFESFTRKKIEKQC